jgi:polysaccharide biosynthesis/export protein
MIDHWLREEPMKKEKRVKKAARGRRNEISLALAVAALVLILPAGCQSQPRVYKIAGEPNTPGQSYDGQGRQRPNNPPDVNARPIDVSPGAAPEMIPTVREYHLGAGDVLKIKINQLMDPDHEETLRVEVDRRGQIFLPLLNHVQAGGLTCEQLRGELALRLGQEFIRNPQVDIAVERFGSKPVTVLGAVRNPGTVNLVSDNAGLMDVISLAGGISGVPSDNIEILRAGYSPIAQAGGLGGSDAGYVQRELVPVSHLFAEDGRHVNPVIFPGDVVKVPNSENGLVFLAGAVSQPGARPYYQSMTILQAVSCAGGPNHIADETKCKIIRRQLDGSEKSFVVNLEEVRKGKKENVLVARNDTIEMAVDPGKKFFDDLGRLFHAGAFAGVNASYDPVNSGY